MTQDPKESRRDFMRNSLRRVVQFGGSVASGDEIPAKAYVVPKKSAENLIERSDADTHERTDPQAEKGPIWLNQASVLGYERLGRTELMIRRVALGGAKLRPQNAAEIIQLAVERGTNYIDTALNYGESELAIGAVLPDVRDKVWIATKTPPFDASLADGERDDPEARDRAIVKLFEESLASSLARLKVSTIDVYIIQCVERVDTVMSEALAAAMLRARETGKIRHTGLSTIRNVTAVANAAIDSGFYDVLMLPLHPLNLLQMKPIIQRANKKDMGILGMMSTIGLTADVIANPPDTDMLAEGMNPHQMTYLYMLKNGEYPALVSNMSRPDRVDPNAALAQYQLGYISVNELDGAVYDLFWPWCTICGQQRDFNNASFEGAYRARYKLYDTSGTIGSGSSMSVPEDFLKICELCAKGEDSTD